MEFDINHQCTRSNCMIKARFCMVKKRIKYYQFMILSKGIKFCKEYIHHKQAYVYLQYIGFHKGCIFNPFIYITAHLIQWFFSLK